MPILDSHSMEFISRSAEQTRRVGMRLGELLQLGDVISLIGELGSGKTTFVKGIAAGWGSLDAVTSPTFVLVNVYRRFEEAADKSPGRLQGRLYHLDAYRLSGSAEQVILEALDLDLDDMLATGVLVVEWAERVQAALPSECLTVKLDWVGEMGYGGQQRNLIFSAQGERYQTMLTALRNRIYGVR